MTLGGNPDRVPGPSRDGLRWAKPSLVHAQLAGTPTGVPRPRLRDAPYFLPLCAFGPIPAFSSRNAVTQASGAFQLIASSLADQASMLSA